MDYQRILRSLRIVLEYKNSPSISINVCILVNIYYVNELFMSGEFFVFVLPQLDFTIAKRRLTRFVRERQTHFQDLRKELQNK